MPEKVLDTRYSAEGVLEALVQWQGLPTHETSWEVLTELRQQFPAIELGDKLSSEGGGGIDKLNRVYVRKKKALSSDDLNGTKVLEATEGTGGEEVIEAASESGGLEAAQKV